MVLSPNTLDAVHKMLGVRRHNHSYKLNDAEQRYPVGEQELLAVITL